MLLFFRDLFLLTASVMLTHISIIIVPNFLVLFTICFSAFSTFSFFLTTTFLICNDVLSHWNRCFYFSDVEFLFHTCGMFSYMTLFVFFGHFIIRIFFLLSLFIYLIQISLFLLWISHHILQSHSHSSVLPYLSSTHVTSSQKKITN